MKRSNHRHAFRFKVTTNDGKDQILVAWARVRKAKSHVDLTLTADDVRRSIHLKGVGDTQRCSMAVCAKRQSDRFPHSVEGYIDWQYSTAYVVSKVSKETGMPIECWAYRHADEIAKLNDTKGGQQKLLKDLEDNGDRVIRLYPPQVRNNRPGRPKGHRDGSRSSRPATVGAKLRFAMAQLGGVS